MAKYPRHFIKTKLGMIPIEDKTTAHYKNLVREALSSVFSIVPAEDFTGIEKIVLLDECPNSKFNWAGGFYYSSCNDKGAIIELYPPKILSAKPFFFPRTKFSNGYSIVKMFLHELGHHKTGNLDSQNRELQAQNYMLTYIQKIYGYWIYFFDFLARIGDLINKIMKPCRQCT